MGTDLMVSADQAIQDYLNGNTSAVDNQVQDVAIPGATGYMRFNGSTGDWIIGKNEIASVPSMWAFLALEAKAQWTGWENGRPTQKKTALIVQGGFDVLPEEAQLPTLDVQKEMDGWKKDVILPVYDLEGDHGQLELTLKADNKYRPIWGFIDAWNRYTISHRTAKNGNFIPIVEIGSEGYIPKRMTHTVYTPVLNIDRFITPEEMENMRVTEDDDDADVEEYKGQDAEPAKEPAKPKTRFQQRKGGRTA